MHENATVVMNARWFVYVQVSDQADLREAIRFIRALGNTRQTCGGRRAIEDTRVQPHGARLPR